MYTSVSLTVEGGVSLVGEHCPGTVRLLSRSGPHHFDMVMPDRAVATSPVSQVST